MVCVNCGKEIQRGGRYKGEKLKSLAFCSEQCYTAYTTSSSPANLKRLKDYINNQWNEDVNWSATIQYIKYIKENYGLSYVDIYGILRYAIEIEEQEVNPEYGLGQFIPKYIEPYQDFIHKIQTSRRESEDMPDILPQKVKPNKQGSSRVIKIMGDIFDEIS